jgi:predicted patatin/cPLA2 family phospholipase
MGKLFSLFNRRQNVIEPSVTRQRQPLNAPLDSKKINLYFDQFVVDVSRLDSNIDKLNASYDEVAELLDAKLDSATPRLLLLPGNGNDYIWSKNFL